MTHDILVVEDEASLLRGIVRGLQADPNLVVEGFPTVELALEHLARRGAPDVLITDIRLPGLSGLDLIQELDTRGLRIPVVVTTAHRSAYQDRMPHRAGLTVLEKPVPLVELRKAVRDHLEDARAGGGRSGPFQLGDYLRLAALGRHSVALEATLDSGAQARLTVVDGLLWSVDAGDESGAPALRRLLGAPLRGIRCLELAAAPVERQFSGTTDRVLLELSKNAEEKPNAAEAKAALGSGGERSRGARAAETPAEPAAPDRVEAPPPSTVSSEPSKALGDGDAPLRELLAQVPEASRVALLAPGRGILAAVPGASSVRTFRDPVLAATLTLFRADDPGSVPLEAFVSTSDEALFLRRAESGAVVALVLPGSAKAGLGWVAIRNAARALRQMAVSDRASEEPSEAALAVRLDEELMAECQRLAAHLEDAGSAEILDFENACLTATSRGVDRAVQAAASPILDRLLRLLRSTIPAGLDREELDEVSWSSTAGQCFAKRLPRTSRLLVLSAGARARSGITWVALRESVASLSA